MKQLPVCLHAVMHPEGASFSHIFCTSDEALPDVSSPFDALVPLDFESLPSSVPEELEELDLVGEESHGNAHPTFKASIHARYVRFMGVPLVSCNPCCSWLFRTG